MNRLRLIKTAYTALACLMLAACASDELTDGTVQDLPEGKYPLQISSVTMSAESTAQPWGADTPQTRVAENITDGKSSAWENGDLITVQIGDDNTSTGTYSVDVDASGNVTGLTTKTTLYWKNKTAQKVKGWYPADITNDISLKNQGVNGAGLAYALYAETVNTVDYQTLTPIELPFSHQLAKVRVVLKGSGKDEVKEVKVYTYPACKFTPNNATTKVTGSGNPEYIPMKKTTYDNGVTYWEANVVPNFILKGDAFQLVVDENPVKCSITQVTPQAGQLHLITLTVIENYTEVDVSNITSTEYPVSGKVHLKGNGQLKNLKITVEAGSKLILENVNLNPQSVGSAITCKGDATISIKGTNALVCYQGTNVKDSYGILVENGTLVINGENDAQLTVTGQSIYSTGAGIGAFNKANITINGGHIIANKNGIGNSAGIGSAGEGKTCGIITITGGIIESWGGNYSAGIGGSNSGACGDIIIKGGNIKAYGGLQSPGIGNGDDASCGDISISGANTEVYAKKGSENGKNPESIGWNKYNGSCGKVTIGSECKVTKE